MSYYVSYVYPSVRYECLRVTTRSTCSYVYMFIYLSICLPSKCYLTGLICQPPWSWSWRRWTRSSRPAADPSQQYTAPDKGSVKKILKYYDKIDVKNVFSWFKSNACQIFTKQSKSQKNHLISLYVLSRVINRYTLNKVLYKIVKSVFTLCNWFSVKYLLLNNNKNICI